MISKASKSPFTYDGVGPLTEASQQGQCDEIPKAGSHGCGHVVRVDSQPLGADNHSHHKDTSKGVKHKAVISL